jgi:hypothetical protein
MNPVLSKEATKDDGTYMMTPYDPAEGKRENF